MSCYIHFQSPIEYTGIQDKQNWWQQHIMHSIIYLLITGIATPGVCQNAINMESGKYKCHNVQLINRRRKQ